MLSTNVVVKAVLHQTGNLRFGLHMGSDGMLGRGHVTAVARTHGTVCLSELQPQNVSHMHGPREERALWDLFCFANKFFEETFYFTWRYPFPTYSIARNGVVPSNTLRLRIVRAGISKCSDLFLGGLAHVRSVERMGLFQRLRACLRGKTGISSMVYTPWINVSHSKILQRYPDGSWNIYIYPLSLTPQCSHNDSKG